MDTHKQVLETLHEYLRDSSQHHFKPCTYSFMNLKADPTIDELPCSIVYGQDRWIREFVITRHLISMFKLDVIQYLKYQKVVTDDASTFLSSGVCIKVRCHGNIDFLKTFLLQRNINGHRHCVILEDMDQATEQTKNSLKGIMESRIDNAYFVVSCASLSRLPLWLKSHGMFINCALTSNIADILSALSPRKTPIDKQRLKELVWRSENDLMISLSRLQLDVEHPELYIGYRYAFVSSYLDSLLIIKRSDGYSIAYHEKLVEFATKVNASCLPVQHLCKDILKYIMERNKPRLPFENLENKHWINITNILANTNMLAIKTNKIVFVIESQIDKLIEIFLSL